MLSVIVIFLSLVSVLDCVVCAGVALGLEMVPAGVCSSPLPAPENTFISPLSGLLLQAKQPANSTVDSIITEDTYKTVFMGTTEL